jgi:hypothetical protein
MTNINFLIEIKQEYTTQLINILTPLIYEGINSIYHPLIDISSPDNILIDFQNQLQLTPNWSNTKIQEETERIKTNSKSYIWLEDLIKATLKSYIIVLTYNPSSNEKIDPSSYKNIKINDFIHKIYIECAREFWNNPYLFYHNYPIIELKRNHRDSISIIKECIKEALRKLLPLDRMLKIYLQEENTIGSITEPPNYMGGLLEKENDLKGGSFLKPEDEIKYTNDNLLNNIESRNNSFSNETTDNHINQEKNDNKSFSDADTVGSQILNIINKNIHEKDIKLTDKTSDKEVNNKIFNDLDTETSINKNYNHPEVYSNAINKKNITNETKSVLLNKNKNKFLSNYLKI